jgi:parvulin-like peptidyl-prolyl isomerase
MFQDHYADRTQTQLAQMFGSSFAAALLAAPVGSWQGPFESGLGWHVVWTEEVRAGEAPSYESVESQVRDRWTSEQREAAKSARVAAMLARYEVVLPDTEAVTRALARAAAVPPK